MHKACTRCVLWAHASDFVTSRPILMRLVRSAFEWNLFYGEYPATQGSEKSAGEMYALLTHCFVLR